MRWQKGLRGLGKGTGRDLPDVVHLESYGRLELSIYSRRKRCLAGIGRVLKDMEVVS